VLARIVASYGAPAEVADAYRTNEVRVQAALRTPPPRPKRTALGRFFGVYSDPRAYLSLAYMLLALATGILYFTFVVTGVSMSVGLAVLIVGIPFFLLFVGTARVLALAEGRIVESMLGTRMPRRPVHPGPPAKWPTRLPDMHGAELGEQRRERRDRLVIKSSGRIYFVRIQDIDWCEASGNYVRLHIGEQTHLVRGTMSHLESQLDPAQFVRIHRSAIVNVERIQELRSSFNGEYQITLTDKTRLTLSRGYRDGLQARLGKTL